uniref:putative cyclin-D6-1 n=1 Tax=Erigeron canadensis TaxID=72917 RepID=UPI001CB94E36|nr:putative cyclin-D6-1 [Erigeron canadensis]
MECYNPSNPLELPDADEEEHLARTYFDVEVDFMVHPGYRTDDRFIGIRHTALSAIVKYTCDQNDAFVPYLAINYVDRFLSTNINIPVILNGQGVKRNVELFAFSCVSIASKIRSSDFSVSDLLKHQLAEFKDDVEIMELHIMEGLNQRVRPVTAITFMYLLLPGLLIKEVQQQPFPTTFAARIIFQIHKDIRFTEFRPSTLAASAILASTYERLPGSHSQFLKKISSSSVVIQSEV